MVIKNKTSKNKKEREDLILNWELTDEIRAVCYNQQIDQLRYRH